MQDFLAHPAVQAAVVPLAVGLAAAALLLPLRLSGLAAAAGLLAADVLIGNFSFSTLTATRKLVVAAMVAPLLGAVVDLAFRPTRLAGVVLGALFGAAALWVFWSVLAHQPLARGLGLGAAALAIVLWTVAATLPLGGDAVRAGAAGVGLGVGAGVGAVLGASALIGQYGIALGAASGGFLLPVMLLGRRVRAGAALCLTVGVAAPLLACAAVLLAQLPWAAAALLGLVPLAVRLPLPDRLHPGIQAVVAVFYALVPAAGSWAVAWAASRTAG
ncbi:MAG: hypothetical protein R3357_04950 [Burkholderiales bacterium]|nr:hypothetical protein [Burkholderiales bacterium]